MRALLWLGWAAALANSFVAPTPRRAPLRKHSRDRTRAFAAPDDDIDALEVRLDVTILWCHCLARELCRELTHNPPKAVPGFTVADLSALAAVVASSSCLSVLWVAVGALTKQFSPADSEFAGLRRTAFTVAGSAPLWLAFERLIQAPVSRDEAGLASVLGLLATMGVTRLYR